MGQGKPQTFSETLLILEYNLCQSYTALSPYSVDRMRYTEVMEMYGDLRRIQIELERQREIENDPNRPKFIPATTNDW